MGVARQGEGPGWASHHSVMQLWGDENQFPGVRKCPFLGRHYYYSEILFKRPNPCKPLWSFIEWRMGWWPLPLILFNVGYWGMNPTKGLRKPLVSSWVSLQSSTFQPRALCPSLSLGGKWFLSANSHRTRQVWKWVKWTGMMALTCHLLQMPILPRVEKTSSDVMINDLKYVKEFVLSW